MGSCISKFNLNRNSREGTNDIVQEKLVIDSQGPISPFPLSSKSPISTSFFYSSSCATSRSTCKPSSSSSSSSSLSSSIIYSKERSFSNDFLRSCIKENPHIISNIDPFNLSLDQKSMPKKVCAQKLNPSVAKPNVAVPTRQSFQKKRARANSPTLTRQKSFRKEIQERSPSPSRRFNGENYNYNYKGGLMDALKEKRAFVNKGSLVNNARNENLKHKETCTHHIGSKIGEMEVGERLVNEDRNSTPTEDIGNPLIALDCFIFM